MKGIVKDIIIVYSLMSWDLLFSVQFPSCVIEFTRTTLDTNIENGIFFITLTMDLKQNENLALLPKLKVILISSLRLQHE